jgi:hypothetical protein
VVDHTEPEAHADGCHRRWQSCGALGHVSESLTVSQGEVMLIELQNPDEFTELTEHRAPSPDVVQAFPLRMIL